MPRPGSLARLLTPGVVLIMLGCSGEVAPGDSAATAGSGATVGGAPAGGSTGTGSTPGAGQSSGGSTSTAGGSTSAGGTGAGGTTTQGSVPVTTRVARLTHEQYARTMTELFGITDDPTDAFAPDALNGFEFDTGIDLLVDARLGPQYRAAAESLAARAVSDDAIFSRVVTCDTAQATCRDDFLRGFGQRAFRRPLTADEVSRFGALFDQGATLVGSGDAFRDGVEVALEAFLQSPQFLYRTELSQAEDANGNILLDDWEVASRLSYFLWSSMPDQELFALASQGALGTEAERVTAVARLLSDPRVQEKAVSFHRQAWHFDRFSKIRPDATTYPGLPPDIVDRVTEASTRFVEEVIATGGGLTELLTAPYAFADSALAPLYGATVAGDMTRIDLDTGVRRGFLMQVGFLASHAYAIKTDPIHRGLFVVRDLLCRPIPDPPPGASMTPLPSTPTPPQTTREEIALLTGQPTCVACHTEINAPGFAFEGFDAVGQVRAAENDVPVDTTGLMRLDGTDLSFQSPTEVVQALAQSPEARACYVGKWLAFAYGRKLSTSDTGARDALSQAPRSIQDLMQAVAVSPDFVKRGKNEVAP